MGIRTYDYVCETCETGHVLIVEYDERDKQCCSECKLFLRRVPSVPNISTAKLSKSYIDGIRSNTKEFADLRVQSELEDNVHDADNDHDRITAEKELTRFLKK